MNATSTLTDRLAAYRPTLDAAIVERARQTDDAWRHGLLALDDIAVARLDDRRSPGTRLAIGTAAAVVVGGLTVIAVTRPDGATGPTGTDPARAPTESTADVTVDTNVGTTPATTVLGGGASLPCQSDDGQLPVPPATLYLGGPANDQNLALPGSIFALGNGVPAVDVAVRAIGSAVVGYDCNITTSAPADGSVTVAIDPPAAATRLTLEVALVERDNAVSVTAITGSTDFETSTVEGTATLTFREALPSDTAQVQVRFKKGDDVWELTADAAADTPIPLTVPRGETDRFPGEPVDWVLYTALDDQYLLVDAGGATL